MNGDDQTVGLFKPIGEEDAPKSAAALKKPGACQVREVATSAWNEICGIGDYPLTIPLKAETTEGPQEGSVMAWRTGAKELADVYVTESEGILKESAPQIKAALENPGVMDIDIKPKSFKVSLDGRPGTKKLSDLHDEINIKPRKSPPERQFLEQYDALLKQLTDLTNGIMEVQLNGKPVKVSLAGGPAPDGSTTSKLDELVAKIDAKPEEAKRRIAEIDDDDAQELMALHVATLQLDARNAANVMFTETEDGRIKPFAIDGGLSLPDKIYPSDAIYPVWAEENWPQADKPWTDKQKAKFSQVDVKAKAEEFSKYMADNKLASGLEPAAFNRMLASTQMMKIAAEEGLTPRETWSILQVRLDGEVSATEKEPDFLDKFTERMRMICQQTKAARK
jgi:hypothetical protein